MNGNLKGSMEEPMESTVTEKKNGNGNLNGSMEEPMESAVTEKKNGEDCGEVATNLDSNQTELLLLLSDDNNEEHLINKTNHIKTSPSHNCCKDSSVTDVSNNINENNSTECSQSLTHSASSITEAPVSIKKENGNLENETTCCKSESLKNLDSEAAVVTDDDYLNVDGESEESTECDPADTVNVNTDSDIEMEENIKDNIEKVKINNFNCLKNKNKLNNQNKFGSLSPEVHEIVSDNDDCVVTSEDNSSTAKITLRRSTRTVKRKVYKDDIDDIENGDFESDIEEVAFEHSLNHKTAKPIVINDTKALVQMAAKQMKINSTSNLRKETTVVIIDTNSFTPGKNSISNSLSKTSLPNSNSSFSSLDLYQNIMSRGTTVTPVNNNNKNNTSNLMQAQAQTSLPILPSLSDDMFVVEAPSFIVPYVYEKPSIKPFREFVDILGKELEESAKENQQIDKGNGINQEKNKKSDTTTNESEGALEISNIEIDDDNKKRKKSIKEERRKRNNEDDDASWDGESSSDSEDEMLSDEENTVIIKDSVNTLEELKSGVELKSEKVTSGKKDSYFDCSLGQFFLNIGLNLAQEYVQNDLLKQQNRILYKEKRLGQNTKATESSIIALTKNLELSKENNAPFLLPQIKCEFCSFRTESRMILAQHLETPHMKNNIYNCNYCDFAIRSPHDILYHMDVKHNVKGKLEKPPSHHQCPNCPFEDNNKGKLVRHQMPCSKKFKPDLNLAPPTEWEPPAKIPKMPRLRHHPTSTYQNAFNRALIMGKTPMNIENIRLSPGFRPRGRSPMSVPPRPSLHNTSIVRGGAVMRQNNHMPIMSSNYTLPNTGVKNATTTKSSHQPSISITPLPRQPAPQTQNPVTAQGKNSFVICEICDGYIKDLEQLRNHMQWIHKVKIHPKMIYNRPPLNCQKCQFRFFTDQGLERHLLGSHGLVTSSMQEAANKGKDAGRCPVCGRVYQWKLLNHVGKDHNLTLKPAHLSYKCTVCAATFGMYKQFENHVYSAHSVVAKRVMDKSKTNSMPSKVNESLLKPLKINDEITIIPQPAKSTTPVTKEK